MVARRAHLFMLFTVLLLSGAAGLVNQVVWQRGLKLYLGGSESISAMVVVLVFMLGLGLGSFAMGFRASRVAHPLRLFVVCELALCAVNLAIAWLLSLDLSDSVYGFQRAALAAGLPLRLVYATSAFAVLLLPCFLMGLTVPLASEAAQRQLGQERAAVVDHLFAINTIGAVLGALASGYYLLPHFGQRASLIVGASLNALAGVSLAALWLGARVAATPAETDPGAPSLRSFLAGRIRREEWIGFLLGFLALAYKMLLMRLVALVEEPLPTTFAFVLCSFLVAWSVGVWLAAHVPERIGAYIVLTVILVAAIPTAHSLDRPHLTGSELLAGGLVYFLPCLLFGLLFGQVIGSFVEHWGNDVGRYLGMNTVGSALGILAMTLLGFRMDYDHVAWAIALGFVGVLAVHRRAGWLAGALVVAGVVGVCWIGARQPSERPLWKTYASPDGVVEIDTVGNLWWDGLWHSGLAKDGNHLGTVNWNLAALPIIGHGEGGIRQALCIGLGTGITAATLAQLGSIESVDVYEINRGLDLVLRDHPEGTLRVSESDTVNMIWQDARSGLALETRQYDVITQQPLYLKQAGSSILLSEEYMRLVRSRLKPGGVFCIYSNSLGNDAQALLVRRTAARVFTHCESYHDGYLLLASDSPIRDYRPELGKSFAASGDLFWQEVTPARVFPRDTPRLEWNGGDLRVTDDHPLVEYPETARRLLEKR